MSCRNCSLTADRSSILISGLHLAKSLRILWLSDAHLSLDDERGVPFTEYSHRMAGGYGQAKTHFDEIIAKATPGAYDYIVCTGDMVSFPTEAGVDYLIEKLNATGVPWAYTCGNHDWHYEGMEGTEEALRAEWAPKRLGRLFQGRNPWSQAIDLPGVRLVLIDDSDCEILPEQLAFWREQVASGLPLMLMMHIPIYVPGRDPVNFSVGHPDWNASTDLNWKIERRLQWPDTGHTDTTMTFCDEVAAAPNLVGIFTGHVHFLSQSYYQGAWQITAPATGQGGALTITVQ